MFFSRKKMYIVDEISAKTAQKSQKIIAKQDRNNIRSISSEERGQLVTTVVVFVQMKMFFFICHIYPRESELYRYVLGGMSAFAWELPFSWCLGHLSSTQRRSVPLSALPKDTTSELAGLFSTTSFECRVPSREAVNTIF